MKTMENFRVVKGTQEYRGLQSVEVLQKMLLDRYLDKSLTITGVSSVSGLNSTTISRFIHSQTKQVQSATVIALFQSLNFRVYNHNVKIHSRH